MAYLPAWCYVVPNSFSQGESLSIIRLKKKKKYTDSSESDWAESWNELRNHVQQPCTLVGVQFRYW